MCLMSQVELKKRLALYIIVVSVAPLPISCEVHLYTIKRPDMDVKIREIGLGHFL